MAYDLQITRRAQRALAALPNDVYSRARDAIRQLATDPRPPGCNKLRGREGWRIRVGNYRIIYEIDDQRLMITILHIGPSPRCLPLIAPRLRDYSTPTNYQLI